MVARPPRIQQTSTGRFYFKKYNQRHYFSRRDDFNKILKSVIQKHKKKLKKVKRRHRRKNKGKRRKVRRRRVKQREYSKNGMGSSAFSIAIEKEVKAKTFEQQQALQGINAIERSKEKLMLTYGNKKGTDIMTDKQLRRVLELQTGKEVSDTDVRKFSDKLAKGYKDMIDKQTDLQTQIAALEQQKQAATLETNAARVAAKTATQQAQKTNMNAAMRVADANFEVEKAATKLQKLESSIDEKEFVANVSRQVLAGYWKDVLKKKYPSKSKDETNIRENNLYNDPNFINYVKHKYPTSKTANYFNARHPVTASSASVSESEVPPLEVDDAASNTTFVTGPNELLTDDEASQDGDGKTSNNGLTSVEITKYMKNYKNFVGVYAADQLGSVPANKSKFGFIMNTEPIRVKHGHWIAVYLDSKDSKSLEYFDPFGLPSNPQFNKDIKKLIDSLKLDFYLKYKINKVKVQDVRTNTCGWHSMQFLIDRFKGKPFVECSGWSDARRGEKRAKSLKKKFKYI